MALTVEERAARFSERQGKLSLPPPLGGSMLLRRNYASPARLRLLSCG